MPFNDSQNSLKAGERGPRLPDDSLLRKTITHFDLERISERVVDARVTGVQAGGCPLSSNSVSPASRALSISSTNAVTCVV